MRAIAKRAHVSLGNAYYYFGSKDHLIQGFYDRTHLEHIAAVGTRLDKLEGLKERLQWVMRKKLETIAPYHQFAGVLFRSASDPNSPLNPFSTESQPVRREATAIFERVVAGVRSIPKDFREELPNLLWLYHMGVVLYWIHDKSEGQWRTWKLMERSVDLIAKVVWVASMSGLGRVRRNILGLLRDLRADGKHEAPGTAQ